MASLRMSLVWVWVALLVASARGQSSSVEFDERWITRAPPHLRYPYSVLISLTWTSNLTCSGTLISTHWVLTAARCLQKRHVKLEADTSLTVHLRAADRLHLNDSGVQTRSSAKVMVHLDNKHSVALVLLDRDFDLNMTDVATLTTFKILDVEDRFCESVSYGARANDASGRKVILHDARQFKCHGQLGKYFKKEMSDKFISDLKESTEYVCEGDFGAGLMCDGELQAVCVGTVTLKNTKACSIAEEQTSPCKQSSAKALFVDICFYLTWLKKNLPHVHVPTVPCEGTSSATSFKPKIDLLLLTLIINSFRLIRSDDNKYWLVV